MAIGCLRWLRRPLRTVPARGFLTRLARDARGNVLAIGAAAIIPIAGMVGGGIDLSRMYIVKTRMQHACDAGALAGRKAMGSGTWSQNSNKPGKIAEQSYDANFPAEAYGSNSTSKSFSETAGVVTGTATTVLPMTIMKVLGKSTETLTVTCDAEMRLPNTDVMFVLDTTGSMDEKPSGDSKTKMASLKEAVKCFYEIVARLDTDANCTTGAPSGGTGNQVQIRFGFVPYATNVNVGRLLKPEWFADKWFYQTRQANFVNDPNAYSWVQRDQPVTTSTDYPSQTGVPQSYCTTQSAAQSGYNSSTDTYSNGNNVKTTLAKTVTSVAWTTANNGTCTGTRPWVQTIYDKVYDTSFKDWTYDRLEVDVSGLKNGATWRQNFTLPIDSNGSNKTIGWDGCIEERDTVKQASYDPIPAGAKDLDIDLVPSSTAGTKWGMVLPDVIYTRQSTGNSTSGWSMGAVTTTANYTNSSYYACPVAARRMQQWPVANDFDNYVDSLTPEGNTYHDIGLLWGARLLSPTGLFASDNALTPQGGEIERNLIFMTDGDACTDPSNYTAYGVNWFDRRQTSGAPTGGCTSTGTMTQQVNARMAGLCTAIKNKNIVLWVIAFGNLANSTEDRLEDCATPGRYFKATNAATLQATFKSIADQISMLRLTR